MIQAFRIKAHLCKKAPIYSGLSWFQNFKDEILNKSLDKFLSPVSQVQEDNSIY